MQDLPPEPVTTDQPSRSGEYPSLSMQENADGSVVIDLSSLAPPPTECAGEREPDPFNPEILVCRKTMLSPRIGPDYGPSADELVEGSAVPRARLRLGENAEAEANVIKKGVGGIDADGAEVRARIKF